MIIPVILSGGAGTRLWPVSRESYPKPFIRMPDGQSLLQKAYLKAARLIGVKQVVLVTNREYFFQSKDDIEATTGANLPANATYLLEPCGRNTAPAIALATMELAREYGPEAVLLVLPADHLIDDQEAFSRAVSAAAAAAAAGNIVTFGIAPTTPETGFGYIEVAADSRLPGLPDGVQVSRVARFVEKPSRDRAEKYLADGHFLWNAGMFCFRADTMLQALTLHVPDLYKKAQGCFEASAAKQDAAFGRTFEFDPVTFAALPDISIDYAVMENATNVAVVRADFDWSDIGSWSALSELTKPDAEGNRIEGEALLVDSTNLYVRSEGRLVAGVGLSNLMVIDTPDALLIANRDRTQDVKSVVERLKRDGHASVRLHRTVHRPWGTYTVLEEGKNFKIKRLSVKPGASLSLQMHYHRSEHWVVVAGTARVTNGESDLLIRTNESTYIPAGNKHRLENPGLTELIIIEVQSGEYLGEDDIVRFDDVYGRVE